MTAPVTQPPVVVSVLIVNYNGRHLLEACLQSLQRNISVAHEVIVVDNASHDGSVAFIAEHFPTVTLIANRLNAGFTGGNNIAARAAAGRYLLLLNSDTVVKSPIDAVLDDMIAHAECGAMGCRLVYGNGRQQESIGYEPTTLRLVLPWLPLGRWFPAWSAMLRTVPANSPLYRERLVQVEWISGAFLLTPKALWKQLGGLDERYFMYMEDTDYCRRVRESGHSVLYSPACEVTHFEGAGRPWIGERAVLNTTDSYLVYMRKFHNASASFALRSLLAPVFLARSAANLVAAMIGRDAYGKEKSRAFRRAAARLLGVKRGLLP